MINKQGGRLVVKFGSLTFKLKKLETFITFLLCKICKRRTSIFTDTWQCLRCWQRTLLRTFCFCKKIFYEKMSLKNTKTFRKKMLGKYLQSQIPELLFLKTLWVLSKYYYFLLLKTVFCLNGSTILFTFHINIIRKVEGIIRCINFARSSRVSKNPASLLNKKVGQWKKKRDFPMMGK